MRRTLRVLAATALAAGTVVVGSTMMSPASAAASGCEYSFGQNSFSARCSTLGPAYQYRAWVQCFNGRHDGAWVTTNSGEWSGAGCGPWWINRTSHGVDTRPVP
ncbi:hypothetical protein HII36_25840 [Nonomuraea sp. NN258]|uniref:hypothetical protein n=1 Tax=Nonomuraea antri TaxID=2730852 RepID=UPI00156A5EB3|nr:hypothetical protein [Nonomuraea antri]NRQ35221.1 hypothetical protein [Nonomuraea antri]